MVFNEENKVLIKYCDKNSAIEQGSLA